MVFLLTVNRFSQLIANCQFASSLSIDNITVFIGIILKSFAVLVHGPQTHTHTGETTVVKQVLHRHLTGKIREERYTIIRTLPGRSISQRTHFIGEIK